jgi:N-acetylglucosaminyl-diphospho-decaprenol L-rhamnosyltransferase
MDLETDEVTVVIATRNRRPRLLETLGRHAARVIMVDNGSTDGSPEAVRAAFPHVTVLQLGENWGAAARNAGVSVADTPYVAFADDDSYWAPGSLRAAASMLRDHPRTGLLTGKVTVGPDRRDDPISLAMAEAPLGADPHGPGPSVLGFLACAAVVRRDAFLEVGGFAPELMIYGEEELLAMDLATHGWGLSYAPELEVRHLPQPQGRDPGVRRRLQARNRLLVALLRRPPAEVGRAAAAAWRADPGAVSATLPLLSWALRRRRRLPEHVEAGLVRLDGARTSA